MVCPPYGNTLPASIRRYSTVKSFTVSATFLLPPGITASGARLISLASSASPLRDLGQRLSRLRQGHGGPRRWDLGGGHFARIPTPRRANAVVAWNLL